MGNKTTKTIKMSPLVRYFEVMEGVIYTLDVTFMDLKDNRPAVPLQVLIDLAGKNYDFTREFITLLYTPGIQCKNNERHMVSEKHELARLANPETLEQLINPDKTIKPQLLRKKCKLFPRNTTILKTILSESNMDIIKTDSEITFTILFSVSKTGPFPYYPKANSEWR